MASAQFSAQTNALVRKSVAYQKRNVGTNICLLGAPIFFGIILVIIRGLTDTLLLNSPDLQCGCQCVQCCLEKDQTNCTSIATGVCDEDRGLVCKKYNKDRCGIEFSTPQQSSFCEVENPSNWPAIMQVPRPSWRAGRECSDPASMQCTNPPAKMLMTGTNLTLVASFGSDMFGPINVAELPRLANVTQDEGRYVDGYILSLADFQFGTSADSSRNMYLERAFTQPGRLYSMQPGQTCTGLNFTSQVSVSVFLSRLLNVSVPDGTSLSDTIWCVDAPVEMQPNIASIDEKLYCGYRQARCDGQPVIAEYAAAWDYGDSTQRKVNLTFWYNATEGDGNAPDGNYRLPSLLNLAVKAWWKHYTGGSAVELLGVLSMPKLGSRLKLDFSTLLGPLFYTWVVQLLFPNYLSLLVYEKEKRLRIMMKMHGLGDQAYWTVTYLWFLLLYCAYIVVFLGFGYIMQLELFLKTNIGIQIINYFLFGNCMIASAFFLSSFFSSSRTSTVVAFLYVFATGLIGDLMLKTFMARNELFVFFIEWIPAFSLYRGIYEFSEYAFLGVYRDTRGLTFAKLTDPGNGVRATWGIYVVEWFIFLVLGYYIEQVTGNGTGLKRSPLFFLESCFGKKQAGPYAARASVEMGPQGAVPSVESDAPASARAVKINDGPADVVAEHNRVMSMTDFSESPIVVKELRKIYPAQDGGKPKVAVKNLTMAIDRGECFGLLGPNGAGKTTSINMLTGFLQPTGGTAVIEGNDILQDMSNIYRMMGVCPQHDLLWEQLTAREHLMFYGRLKGLRGPELVQAVEAGLKSVNLWHNGVGDKQCGQYSGGMKRRLSVAISFMGSPRCVYLDEPSTGLDPASRRALWDVVKANKNGRAIILTTHSMEEAEILCDRLGIFVDGQLVCLGAPKEITSRYAGYYVFTISVPPAAEPAARELVARLAPSARPTYCLGGTLKYELPASEVQLPQVFKALADAKASGLPVLDWGIANATLEEVFIKLAQSIGAKGGDT